MSVFSRIQAEYGASLYIQSECGKIRTKKTPNTDTSHTVIYQALEINIWLNVNSMLLFDITSDVITAMFHREDVNLNSDQFLSFNYKEKTNPVS